MIRPLRRRREGGYVLAMTALLLVPLLVVSALAVDVGGWYSEASRMQKAADAAALAGVVWLPDLTAATNAARETAKRNGYPVSSNVDVAVTQVNSTTLKVLITNRAAPVYLARFIKKTTTVNRDATAQWTGMTAGGGGSALGNNDGSPSMGGRNYFGTGDMLQNPNEEDFYAAIDSYCSVTRMGDPYSPRYSSVRTTGDGTGEGCHDENRFLNPNFVHTPGPIYRYSIDVPAGHPDLYIYIWDPYASIFWPNGNISDGLMRTRISNPNGSLTSCGTSVDGKSLPNPNPWNSRSFPPTADFWSRFFHGYEWIPVCKLPVSAASGRYTLSVSAPGCTNSMEAACPMVYGPDPQESATINDNGWGGHGGSNRYSLLVNKGSATTGVPATCDVRTDPTCPAIWPSGPVSIFADTRETSKSPVNQLDIPIGSLSPSKAKATFQLTIFDPGGGLGITTFADGQNGGGKTLSVLDPKGYSAQFTYQDMGQSGNTPGSVSSLGTSMPLSQAPHYANPGDLLPDNCNTIDIRECNALFDDHFVKLTVTVPASYTGDASYALGEWKLRWIFPPENASNHTVEDHFTLTVGSGGVSSPVHLVG